MNPAPAVKTLEIDGTNISASANQTILDAARENGILLGKGGLHGNVLRFSPPLNIGKSDVDEFARLLDASLVRASALVAAS